VDGAANEALVRLLARQLGVAPSTVSIAAGAHSRLKQVEVASASAAWIEQLWPGIRIWSARG
jgi:hypothetical protein